MIPGTRYSSLDDERFLLNNEHQMENFRKSLAQSLRKHPDAALIIQADRRVPHGSVLAIMNQAMDVGMRRVNMATQPL